MFETLSFFKVSDSWGKDKSCSQADVKEGQGWSQGTCAASGYGHLWSVNQKTGLALFKNFKRLGADWDTANNAA